MRKKRPGAAFAEWLKDQRKRRHLLQWEMAELCGVSTRQYRRWEGRKSQPRTVNARKVAEAVGVDEDVVFRFLEGHS